MNKLLKLAIIAIVLLLVLAGIRLYYHREPSWQVDGAGIIHYSQERGIPDYTSQEISLSQLFKTQKIVYDSKGTKVYAILCLPESQTNKAVIFLPAAEGTKESRLGIAEVFASFGYAVMVIDQRGIGETQGSMASFEDEMRLLNSEKEPVHHVMFYDVLKAYDVLQDMGFDEVVVSGESMGGRYALIAAALEKRFKGVLAFSTSGFGNVRVAPEVQRYVNSINPDKYVGLISPRKVVMIHSSKDSVIPIGDARQTFNMAGEPKEFVEIKECDHGYCDEMKNEVRKALGGIFLA